jgi:cytochrome c oxidase cbb3-type subunit 2
VNTRCAASALATLMLLSLAMSAADPLPDKTAGAAVGDPAVRPSNTAAASDSRAGNGQALYSIYCAACHQVNGEGVTGAFPPLKGSAVVNRADATKHIDIVLDGLQGARVSGVTYANPMPAFGTALSDADIAAIVDYERGAWGNHGSPVSPAQVASERTGLK